MITKTKVTYRVVDCPICGRPVEVQFRYAGQTLRCGHCGGLFEFPDMDGGPPDAVAIGKAHLLDRADELLRHDGAIELCTSARAGERPEASAPWDADTDDCGPERLPAKDAMTRIGAESVALLVEPRDEVFASIAADLRAAGMRVTRAMTATQALRLCAKRAPKLVIASTNLPDQSGWLFAAKLRLVDQDTPVWLYQPQSTGREKEMADYLKVDQLFDYGGDLLCLSGKIRRHAAGQRMPTRDREATPRAPLHDHAKWTSHRRVFRKLLLMTLTIVLVSWFGSKELYAAPCCESGSKSASCDESGAHQHSDGHSGQQHAGHAGQQHADAPFRAPHGGQLSKTDWNYFEVVYGPQETRLFVYDMFRFPVPAGGIQGQVTMQVRSNGGKFRYPLQAASGPDGQDYLAVRVDLTRVRDGDMDMQFDLTGLPNGVSPTSRFSQAFAMPRPLAKPQVAHGGSVPQ